MNPDLIRNRLFLAGLLLLAVSLPTSETGITSSLVILLVSWLIDDKLFVKIKSFFTNRIALSFSLLYFVHIIWLINTSDFDYAILDLRTKFSIFLFALIFSTTPVISHKEFRNITLVHGFTVLIASFIGVITYIGTDSVDFRNFSPFISHIRFALNICIAVFTFIYYLFNSKELFKVSLGHRLLIKLGLALITIWLMFFLVLMQSFTGLGIVGIIIFVGFLRYLVVSGIRKSLKLFIIILMFFIPLISSIYIFMLYNSFNSRPETDFMTFDKLTKSGNLYSHDTINFEFENGRWTGLYLCESEMREAWNKRSNIKYDSLDEHGFYVSSTLIRYLTSKDMRKDKEAVNSLSETDVKNIEKGVATVESLKGIGITSRLNTIFFELMRYTTKGEIKGSSLIQRFELLKNSIRIISENFYTGVGTGDVPDAFKQQLTDSNSPLKDTRMRSHNQFLSLFVAFGLFGFLLCLFSFLYPFIASVSYRNYFTIVFLLIFFLSLLTEDTIESLSGATFYAFFGAFYLFQNRTQKLEK